MKQTRTYLTTALLLSLLLTGCNNDDPGAKAFDNKIYIQDTENIPIFFFEEDTEDLTQHITAALARPLTYDIALRYEAVPSLAETFNLLYDEQAVALPAEHYEIPEPTAAISAGSVVSDAIEVKFKEVSTLDKEVVYVLPVSLVDGGGVDVLRSGRTLYYLFKGAALVNVVADIEDNALWVAGKNASLVWESASDLSDMRKLTVEMLVRVRDFSNSISTLVGIENHFLIRLGDTNDRNKVQVVRGTESADKFNDATTLARNRWTHVAVTYDVDENEVCVYIDGKLSSEGKFKITDPVTFARTMQVSEERETSRGFWVGYSYEEGRDLAGDIAELRIWKTIRTADEIAASPYRIDPASEGLAAYWKFNEGKGNTVKDYVHGNDLTPREGDDAPLRWTQVTLPEKE